MSEKPLLVACPHCGNEDRSLISKWIEPHLGDATNGDQKWYCEQCGKTWVVQKLPLEGPDA